MAFRRSIEEIFDCNLTEDIYGVLNEGVIDSARQWAKKISEAGLRILPKEWVEFAQGLYAAAKDSPEAVASFLEQADHQKATALVKAVESDQADEVAAVVAECVDSKKNTINEAGEELAADLAGRASEATEMVSSGMSMAMTFGLAILGIAFAYGLYRTIVAGIRTYKEVTAIQRGRRR